MLRAAINNGTGKTHPNRTKPYAEKNEGNIKSPQPENHGRIGTCLRVFIVLLWLATTAWLIRFEALPHLFTGTLQGYQTVLPSDVLVADSWMNLWINGQPAGYSHYSVQTEETGNQTYYIITNTVELGLRILGKAHRIEMENAAKVDLGYRLQEFHSSITSTAFSAAISAEYLEEGSYDATLSYNGTSESRKLTIPANAVVFTPMTGLNLKNIKVGRETGLRIFDPMTMKPALITIIPVKSEKIKIDDKQYNAMVVHMEYRGTIFKSWLDTEDGALLRQTTPFGLTMQKCDPDNAFLASTNAAEAPDIFQSFGEQLIDRN
ncbi:MAG: hypothetical protein ACOC6C_06735 [Verrucomicrobiota bacterium]